MRAKNVCMQLLYTQSSVCTCLVYLFWNKPAHVQISVNLILVGSYPHLMPDIPIAHVTKECTVTQMHASEDSGITEFSNNPTQPTTPSFLHVQFWEKKNLNFSVCVFFFIFLLEKV